MAAAKTVVKVTQQKAQREHVWAGLLVLMGGILLLGMVNNYTYAEFPLTRFLWIVLLILGILALARATKSLLWSGALSVIVIAALFSYIFQVRLFRTLMAIALIWVGVVLLFLIGGKIFGSPPPAAKA